MGKRLILAAAAALVAGAIGIAPAGTTLSAQSPDALAFFKNYFITGDYVVGGIGLRGLGQNGVATGTIAVNAGAGVRAIPAGAEILAAFLYWQTVVTDKTTSAIQNASFRGNPLADVALELNPNGTTPCWSSGGGAGGANGAHVMKVYRADVLRFLPTVAGRPVADDADVAVAVQSGQAPLDVSMPDAGTGNQVPSTAGASLVVLYSTATGPLRSVVIYDGGYTVDNSTQSMTQRIKGFYQATGSPSAKMTHIVGDGQPNFPERLLFNGVSYGAQFNGALGPAGDPAWDSPTIDVSSAMAVPVTSVPANSGQNVITAVDRGDATNGDCLSWGAIVFSTTVQDSDSDGLLDIWENPWPVDAASQPIPLLDPTGAALPNLSAMGAHSNRKDIFIEIGAMWTPAQDLNAVPPVLGVSYGSGAAKVTDTAGHNHLPARDTVLHKIGDAFFKENIDIHFDVGAAHQTNPPDPYIIPASLARGGEMILETACVEDTQVPPRWTCRFPDYPGTVGWKVGFEYLKEAPVAADGTQLTPAAEAACEADVSGCGATSRRRFDRNRKDMFHYGLFAHAQGTRKSEDPASPDFNVPTRSSGVGDFPGGDFMVTLGAWGYGFRGPEFVQASTLMHEFGHNAWRSHAGDPFSPFEKNCNPNYLSVMNYMYQIQGLSLFGTPTLDFSKSVLSPINENSLPAGFGTVPYFNVWYAPQSTVHQSLGSTPATKHCDGSTLLSTDVPMVRVTGDIVATAPSFPAPAGTTPIDWNGDLNTTNDFGLQQDVSFNGVTNNGSDPAKLLRGSDDWGNLAIGLLQLGSRRNIFGLSLDVGRTDSGRTDSGRTDSGRTDSGRTDSGRTDSGSEQDYETADAVPYPPTALAATYSAVTKTATITWQPPTFVPAGVTVRYQVLRVTGNSLNDINFGKRTNVGQTTSLSIVDNKLKAGETYTYFATARYEGGATRTSPQSNTSFIVVPK